MSFAYPLQLVLVILERCAEDLDLLSSPFAIEHWPLVIPHELLDGNDRSLGLGELGFVHGLYRIGRFYRFRIQISFES